MRWGEQLEYWAEAGPGDFIFVPPFVPHQEMNAQTDQLLECVVVRSDQEPIVVNLEIPMVEHPEQREYALVPPIPRPNAPHGPRTGAKGSAATEAPDWRRAWFGRP